VINLITNNAFHQNGEEIKKLWKYAIVIITVLAPFIDLLAIFDHTVACVIFNL